MKKIIIGLFVIVLSIWAYQLLRSDDRTISAPIVEAEVDQEGDSPQLKTYNTFDKESSTKKYDNSFEQKQISLLCGFNASVSLNKTFLGDKSFDKLSDKQIQALADLKKTCKNWYEYIDALSDTEKEYINSIKQSVVKPHKWYESNIDPRERIQSAKDAFLDDPEGMEFSALYFLLQNDLELLHELAERIETKDWSLIKSSSMHVATLYGCIDNYKNCGSGSLQMLTLCLDDEQYCGYGYEQYLTLIYSPNQFSDIQNIASHLREIIKQGYPDISFQ